LISYLDRGGFYALDENPEADDEFKGDIGNNDEEP
jgi:hypothetical protein